MKDEHPSNDQPVTLVLNGGGSRFPAFVGALFAIEKKGLKIGMVLKTVSRRSRHHLPEENFTFARYARSLLEILVHVVEKELIKGEKWRDTILLYCGEIASTRFSLSRDEVRHLFEQGYLQTGRYLDYKWGEKCTRPHRVNLDDTRSPGSYPS
jgi:hypothetical protein